MSNNVVFFHPCVWQINKKGDSVSVASVWLKWSYNFLNNLKIEHFEMQKKQRSLDRDSCRRQYDAV